MRAGLALHVAKIELRKISAYRSDFWLHYFALPVLSLIITYSLWSSIFSNQGLNSIRGFNLEQLVLYYLLVPIVARVMLGENIGGISREIYEGKLNKYLIYPISFFLYKQVTYLVNGSVYLIQAGIVFALVPLFLPNAHLELKFLIMGSLSCVISCMIYFTFACIVEYLAFWVEHVWSLMVLLRMLVSFLGGGMLPLEFFPLWLQEALPYTPFPYLISLPIKTFMGSVTFSSWLSAMGVQIIWYLFFAALSYPVWKRGNLKYSGVGI